MLASETLMSSRTWSRIYIYIPNARLSLNISHAALVLVGSERAPNEASTVAAFRWSFRKESILREKQIG